MTRRKMMFAIAIGIATFGSCCATWMAEAADDAALIKALGSAKVSLQQGLTASEREGQPISAKFELETASSNCPSTRQRMQSIPK